MLLGHPDLRIRALTEFTGHHEGEHTRHIRLPCRSDKIEHQIHMLIEGVGHAEWRVRYCELCTVAPLDLLNASLDLTDVIEIVVQACAIACAQAALKACRFFGNRIEQA